MKTFNLFFNKIKQWPWSQLSGFIFFILIIWLLLHWVQKGQQWLMDHQQLPIRQVQVEGQLVYSNKNDITQSVLEQPLGSFFSIRVDDIQRQIKELPWIYQVSVRRQWPDKLVVHIVEQQPAAIWNQSLLINTQGEVFQAPIMQSLYELPKLYGPEGSETEALQGYYSLNELLLLAGFNLGELAISERYSWQIDLLNGIQIQLGRQNKVQRLQQFIDLYPTLISIDSRAIDYVDLRYNTGLAVSWQQEVLDQQKS